MTTHRRRQSSIDFHAALKSASSSTNVDCSLSPIVEKTTNNVQTPSRKILLAFDNTESSINAAEFLKTTLIKNGDQIFIAHILPMLDSSSIDDNKSIEQKCLDLKQKRDSTLENLRKLSDAVTSNDGLIVTTTLLVLNHAEARVAICRIADHHSVDLVVIGRRKKDNSLTQNSGSCSSYVLTRSKSPVLIVK